MSKKKIIGLAVVAAMLGVFGASTVQIASSPFAIKRWELSALAQQKQPIRIALLTDFHLNDLARLDKIIASVKKQKPDFVLLGGDYDRKRTPNSRSFNKRYVERFSKLASEIPVYAVLGNHDNKVNRAMWMGLFEKSKVTFIEGKVQSLSVKGTKLCLRGLGDAFSGYYQNSVKFGACQGAKLSLTHDPLGAQIDPEGGLYFAGHTHCLQIKIPYISPLLVPTRSKEALWCGLHKMDDRTVITSGGLGTSIVPVRFGADPAWDLITIGSSVQ